MNFLHAGALVLLSLIPVILVLYFMKLKRKEVRVSSSFLWKKTLEEAKVDSFFQKLRFNILLLLQILFVILAVSALARPYIQSIQNLPPRIVFILDASASMQTREGKKSRFDMARDRIAQMVEGARRGTFFALIRATTRARLESGFTADRQEFLGILRNLQPCDTSTSLEPSIQLATSLLKSEPQARMYLLSDGGGDMERIWGRYSPYIYHVPIGSTMDNTGIIAFDLRETSNKGAFQAFVTVRNFSPAPAHTYLSLYLDAEVKEARELQLKPDESRSFIFDLQSKKAQTLEIRIDIHDALAVDNQVMAKIPETHEKRICLVTTGNPFLEKLLSLMSSCRVEKIRPPVKQEALKKADLVIWDQAGVSFIPKGGAHFFIQCSLPGELLAPEKTIALKSELSWDTEHPVNRYVDYSALTVAESPKVQSPPWGKVLLSSQETDLMILLERGRHRSIAMCFNPFGSNLYLSPVFPILMNNICDYFLKIKGMESQILYAPEESIPLEFDRSEGAIRASLPGAAIDLSPGAQSFSETWKTGLYLFRNSRREVECAVNLADEYESAVAPKVFQRAPGPGDQNDATASPMITEFWRPMVFIALLLLLLEWSAFHRRRQG